jgi:hypothetical protein
MLPRPAADSISSGNLFDATRGGKIVCSNPARPCRLFPQGHDICCGHLGHSVLFALGSAALLVTVFDVFGSRPDEEMIGTHARWVVATMADAHSVWDRAAVSLIRDAVCCASAYRPIPSLAFPAKPHPAFSLLPDQIPAVVISRERSDCLSCVGRWSPTSALPLLTTIRAAERPAFASDFAKFHTLSAAIDAGDWCDLTNDLIPTGRATVLGRSLARKETLVASQTGELDWLAHD